MPNITVIAHNIRSTHNVGAIFRTCEGFGVDKLILSGYTPHPKIPDDKRLPHEIEKTTKQIHKSALDAEELVDFEYFEDLQDWIDKNNQSDDPLPILALEQADNSVNLADFKSPDKFALLLGEEVAGIDKKYLEFCQTILEIPMHGQKESFNVSIACGIALYALTS
ncbi:tRNA methyltransferase [Candidatus Saccharibacteria bacterium]|nr:MAG: tRNA methyltransferase [Candidatus Saccharibacteria bacterium]